MPSLRIPFPEKESPSVVTLRGKRITIGRLPQNTIQIRDRTISAFHAELIEEEGHYRLHDLGATNGVLVNGEPVTDYHLEEACKVTFGGVECEFAPEVGSEEEVDPTLALLTHGQSAALLVKNAELEKTVASLREQITELQKPVGDGQGVADLQRLTEEANALRESAAARDREIKQLKADLSVMHRDRANLQRALNEAKATTAPTPASAPASTEAAEAEKQAELALTPAAVAEPELPKQEKPEPAPALAPAPQPAPAPAAVTPAQPAPTARPAAVPVPAPAANVPVAKPVAPPVKPALPKPKAPLPHATPTAPSAPSMPSAPGAATARPIARPQPAVATNGNGTPTGAPRPAPIIKSPGGTNPQAASKPSLATRPPTAVSGPKGTQKLDV